MIGYWDNFMMFEMDLDHSSSDSNYTNDSNCAEQGSPNDPGPEAKAPLPLRQRKAEDYYRYNRDGSTTKTPYDPRNPV